MPQALLHRCGGWGRRYVEGVEDGAGGVVDAGQEDNVHDPAGAERRCGLVVPPPDGIIRPPKPLRVELPAMSS